MAEEIRTRRACYPKGAPNPRALEGSGPRSSECLPRRGPFLPSSSIATKRGQNRRIEDGRTGLKAAAKPVLFFRDKILAIDANGASGDGGFQKAVLKHAAIKSPTSRTLYVTPYSPVEAESFLASGRRCPQNPSMTRYRECICAPAPVERLYFATLVSKTR